MNEQEYARKILKALQDAGVVGHGMTKERIDRYEDGARVQLYNPYGDVLMVDTVDLGSLDGLTIRILKRPQPGISPTAKALKELKA
jgi:hypothetical protein